MKKFFNVDERKLSFLRFTELVGGAPGFNKSKLKRSKILERFAWVSGMFNDNGSYDFSNKDIEEYALCLNHDGQQDEAYLILDYLARDKEKDILFVSEDNRYPFSPLSGQIGKLGYEGLFLYALLLLNRRKERAIPMFAEIVNKIPIKCYPIRVQDVRVEAITRLLEIQQEGEFSEIVHKYIKTNLDQELEAARKHQY